MELVHSHWNSWQLLCQMWHRKRVSSEFKAYSCITVNSPMGARVSRGVSSSVTVDLIQDVSQDCFIIKTRPFAFIRLKLHPQKCESHVVLIRLFFFLLINLLHQNSWPPATAFRLFFYRRERPHHLTGWALDSLERASWLMRWWKGSQLLVWLLSFLCKLGSALNPTSLISNPRIKMQPNTIHTIRTRPINSEYIYLLIQCRNCVCCQGIIMFK